MGIRTQQTKIPQKLKLGAFHMMKLHKKYGDYYGYVSNIVVVLMYYWAPELFSPLSAMDFKNRKKVPKYLDLGNIISTVITPDLGAILSESSRKSIQHKYIGKKYTKILIFYPNLISCYFIKVLNYWTIFTSNFFIINVLTLA